LSSFFLGFDSELIVKFLEQLSYLGLVEEFFFRGCLMGRFCEWLGDIKGLLLNAVIFSLAHISSFCSADMGSPMSGVS